MKQLIQRLANRHGYIISRRRGLPDVMHVNVLDLVIRRYLETHSQITVLQIGANDGLRADPVNRYLNTYDWKAVLVEPQPRAFEHLKTNYANNARVTLVNCAIAHVDGDIEFFTVHDSVGFRWTGLAQLDRHRLIRALQGHGFPDAESLIQSIKVPALTLRSLMTKHDLTHVDLLQIDTEGFDYDILKMIDFSKIRPSIINFEHACIPLDLQKECWEFVSRQGYSLAFVQGDTIACNNDWFMTDTDRSSY